jgi:hypothetical protein
VLLPVQESGDEERTKRIWVVKSWMSWGRDVVSGEEEKPRPKRSRWLGVSWWVWFGVYVMCVCIWIRDSPRMIKSSQSGV